MRKKANSTKSCGITWTPYSKSGAKLIPTIVTSASLSYCCRKTSVSALCSSPESGLTREKQYILEHSDTERLYCLEPSPSHLSTNQLLFPCISTYVELCGWFWSRSCVSSVSASFWSFFQVKLKNPTNIWKTSDLWLDPNTPILDSFFRSVHQSGSAVLRFSTLRPLELVLTLLGRAWSLYQFKVSPRRKLGKWEKSHFYVLETCRNP